MWTKSPLCGLLPHYLGLSYGAKLLLKETKFIHTQHANNTLLQISYLLKVDKLRPHYTDRWIKKKSDRSVVLG